MMTTSDIRREYRFCTGVSRNDRFRPWHDADNEPNASGRRSTRPTIGGSLTPSSHSRCCPTIRLHTSTSRPFSIWPTMASESCSRRPATCSPARGQRPSDDMIVRLDPDVVAQAIASAPSTFELQAPNPDRSIEVGGKSLDPRSGGRPAVRVRPDQRPTLGHPRRPRELPAAYPELRRHVGYRPLC